VIGGVYVYGFRMGERSARHEMNLRAPTDAEAMYEDARRRRGGF
jgi:hypothetical protein